MRLHVVLLSLAGLLGAAAAAAVGADSPPSQSELRERGKALYDGLCARCHGADGGDTTSYPGIKSLVDLTQRMPAPEILAKSNGFAVVDLSGLNGPALLAHLATFRSGGYAEPGLLVEPSWVALHLNDPKVRLVDMRPAEAYAAGHIPGAVRVVERNLRDPDDALTYLPRPEVFAAMMSEAGIDNETHVVVYDDQGGRMGTRLWYVLHAYGHERVSVVNGGWPRWEAEGRPTAVESPAPPRAAFTPRENPSMTCPTPQLLARRPNVVLLDTRSEAEHRGEQVSPGASKAGRIPTSVHVDWRENVTGEHQTFRPAAELRALYEAKGVTPDREIVPY